MVFYKNGLQETGPCPHFPLLNSVAREPLVIIMNKWKKIYRKSDFCQVFIESVISVPLALWFSTCWPGWDLRLHSVSSLDFSYMYILYNLWKTIHFTMESNWNICSCHVCVLNITIQSTVGIEHGSILAKVLYQLQQPIMLKFSIWHKLLTTCTRSLCHS